jgi:outer membrane receptor protein involved in Fe transport
LFGKHKNVLFLLLLNFFTKQKIVMKKISFSTLLALLSLSAYAQTTIKGTITEAGDLPLIGATVLVKGTTIGTATDLDGNYQLKVDDDSGQVSLAVSYTGYATQEKTIDLNGATVEASFLLEQDALGLEEVVVTGVANAKSKLESSVSISTLKPELIEQSAPRTTAEIFRTIPGVRSEASGGDGNTNITVRGIPISAGGSKYLQLQEDGLPVLLFGDIAFATADIFLRADPTISRIEAIRGGSASTLASNSPAGIINFISKTGATEGGSIGMSLGLDYSNFRTDFEYGAPIGNDVSFHIGGFFRQGEGPRTAGYTANYGGQIKANLTKQFKNGFARVYYKYLNDRAIAYMPMPLKVTGTNEDPTWESIAGFDGNYGTPHSPFFTQNLGLGPDGQLRRSNVTDGMHPLSHAIGTEFSFDLGDNWTVKNNARMAFNSGRFVTPFPAEVGAASTIAESVGGTGATLTYADNGAAFGSGNASNGLLMRIHVFDTELNNLNNFANDFKLKKSFDKIDLTLGYFKAHQNISMSWLWNSYLMDVNGEKARMVNVTDANGQLMSDNGLYAYGVPAWGNCCQRNYDVQYDISAPSASLEVQATDAFNIEAGLRWDFGKVDGSFAGPVQTTFDMNNDGAISAPEQSVSAIDNAHTTPVDYAYNYVSYSLGANYKLNKQQAVFARYSHGGSAKADRLLFAGLPYSDGTTLNAKDLIDQAELGYKYRFSNGGLFLTGFYAKTTEEGGFEATTQKIIENDYSALGLEVESAFNFNDFDLRGGLTYTNAEITSGDNKGNRPRRQPALMFNLVPTYKIKKHSVGLSFIGQTSAYAQDNNLLKMPGYLILSGFVNVNITKGLSAIISANNITNALGITESEEGSITEGQTNYLRARPITGRSISGTIRFTF